MIYEFNDFPMPNQEKDTIPKRKIHLITIIFKNNLIIDIISIKQLEIETLKNNYFSINYFISGNKRMELINANEVTNISIGEYDENDKIITNDKYCKFLMLCEHMISNIYKDRSNMI